MISGAERHTLRSNPGQKPRAEDLAALGPGTARRVSVW
jgi:hypothetical protein